MPAHSMFRARRLLAIYRSSMFNVSNYSIPIMNVFDRRYETMPRAELEQLQLERLQALLVRLKRNVRRAREKIGDARVESLADLSRLPFTTPEDMVESFPYGMFALPMREIIRLHTTIGPQGKPLVIGHTRNDLAQWGRLAARQLVAFGVTANDVVQMCFGGGVYGAAGYLFGAQVIEASVIAEDSAHVDYQIATLQNFQPTVLITTPGNALDLMQVMDNVASTRSHSTSAPSCSRARWTTKPVNGWLQDCSPR